MPVDNDPIQPQPPDPTHHHPPWPGIPDTQDGMWYFVRPGKRLLSLRGLLASVGSSQVFGVPSNEGPDWLCLNEEEIVRT